LGKCKTCGKPCDSDFCFAHKPRKAFKKSNKLNSKSSSSLDIIDDTVSIDVINNYVEKSKTMYQFFYDIWKKRPHKSEVSGEYLGKEPLSAYFHHIMAKSKYPELAYKEDNIVLLTLDEHATVESDMYRYDEVNKRRELLINKYLKNE
jgi:hypothetical protein